MFHFGKDVWTLLYNLILDEFSQSSSPSHSHCTPTRPIDAVHRCPHATAIFFNFGFVQMFLFHYFILNFISHMFVCFSH